MPQLRLNKRNIDDVQHPASGQVFYLDDQIRGFGLRVGSRSKTFFAEAQVNRRTVRVTIGPYGPISPERARKLALQALGDMAEGKNPNADRKAKRAAEITLEEAFDAFFEGRPSLSANTIPNYKRSLRLYLSEWRKRPLAEVTRQMVLARHRRLGEKHGEVTANCVMRHLRSVYNYTSASAEGVLPANPVEILSQARAWNTERRRRTVIPMHALPRWFAAVATDTEDARDFLRIALFTGMRRSEVASLRWEHVDLVGETLTVPRTKNGDPLVLPLSWYLCDLLIGRRQALPAAEWVFPGRGKTGHLTEMKTFADRVAKASGVPFTLHDLRRTFVTIAESLDIPAYALKRLLNHRIDTDVTGGYIVIDAERLRAPVNRIAERILEAASEEPAERIKMAPIRAGVVSKRT